jgi:hypothetical protein
MVKRSIEPEEVEDVLRNPGQIVMGYGGRKIAQKICERDGGEYLLRVVCEEQATEIIVVTAYLTSDISRYWEK